MRHAAAVSRTRAAVAASVRDLPAGSLALAAVSGGADSVALAAALARVAARQRLRAGAVVVDHGLQAGSAGRAAATARQCRELGLDPVVVEAVAVGRAGGPEAAAREARYAALHSAADRLGAAALLLGHTLDDQAETVLLGLARGSGARSLAGMPERTDRLRRPFLGLRRATTRAACAALSLDVWDDPHNDDPSFARVRVRTAALPAVEVALGPGVAEALARTARLLRDDAEALEEWAKAAAGCLDVPDLLALPRAVRTRVLRQAAIDAGSPAGSLTAGHVAAIERLVTHWHGQGPVSLPGGLVAERRYDRLSFR